MGKNAAYEIPKSLQEWRWINGGARAITAWRRIERASKSKAWDFHRQPIHNKASYSQTHRERRVAQKKHIFLMLIGLFTFSIAFKQFEESSFYCRTRVYVHRRDIVCFLDTMNRSIPSHLTHFSLDGWIDVINQAKWKLFQIACAVRQTHFSYVRCEIV